MEAALATIVANAQKKLDAGEEAPAAVAEEAPAEVGEVIAIEDQKVAAPVVTESFTLDRTQPVEESPQRAGSRRLKACPARVPG